VTRPSRLVEPIPQIVHQACAQSLRCFRFGHAEFLIHGGKSCIDDGRHAPKRERPGQSRGASSHRGRERKASVIPLFHEHV